MISVTVDASSAMAALDHIQAEIIKAVGAALYQGGEAVMAESQKEVPVRYGILKGSGMVQPPEWNGSGWTVVLSYGGAAADYAWTVHEDMTAHHKKGTKAKYLQDPFDRMTPDVIARVQAAVEGAVR